MKKFGYLLILSDLPEFKDEKIKFIENFSEEGSEFDKIKVLFYYANDKRQIESLTLRKASELEQKNTLSENENDTYSACCDLRLALNFGDIFGKLPKEVENWAEGNLMNVHEENMLFTIITRR